MSAEKKLLAEWFWTDRWTGSSAFLLPIDARGLYREMLTQAWRRGACLPNDHEAIRRAIGVTTREWSRCWPKVSRFWRVDGDSLVSDTQREVYAEAMGVAQRASNRGKKGAQARARGVAQATAQVGAQVSTQATAQAPPEHKPPTPTPTPTPDGSKNRPPDPPDVNARSNRPIYKGLRMVVFEWQLDDLMQMLGKHADTFDFHLWFDTLDKRVQQSDEVMPKRDGGRWLQQETLAEARRRGLPIAGEKPPEPDPYAGQSWAWECRACGKVHEGTREQKKRGECLTRAS